MTTSRTTTADGAQPAAVAGGPLHGGLWRVSGAALLVVAVLALAACSQEPATPIAPSSTSRGQGQGRVSVQRGAFFAGEGSGVVASKRYPGVLWAIRDSGPSTANRPRAALYAYRQVDGQLADLVHGKKFAVFPISGAVNTDWEDIARDDQGNIWVADIGDNFCVRGSAALLKVREPDPSTDREATLLATYRFRYPDPAPKCRVQNAESLFLVDGVPYLIDKTTRSAVYRLPSLDPGRTVVLKRLAYLTPPASGGVANLSGADLSADRRRLAVENYASVFVYESAHPSLRGDALVRDLVGHPPKWTVELGCTACPTASQVEGIAFAYGTYDLDMLAENHDVWYVPAAAYDHPG